MACKRSAVRSRLAPPRFALRASRGAATRCPKDGARCPAKPAGRRRAEANDVVRLHHPQRELSRTRIHLCDRGSETATARHSAGRSAHTAKFKPWKLVWYCAFPDKYKALEFEKYLKSHSGRAFAKKRLTQPSPPRKSRRPLLHKTRHAFAEI